jgi:hypothetical protein
VLGEVREGSDRVGFEVVTLDDRNGPLASSKISSSSFFFPIAFKILFVRKEIRNVRVYYLPLEALGVENSDTGFSVCNLG